MKKISLVFTVAIMLYACGNSSTETKKEEPAKQPVSDNSANPDYQKGLELIAKNDCLTCHKVDDKVTGPSYRDVANKYSEKDISMLAGKIIKGGTGVWGSLLMTPHATLSQADAEQMVKYILLLKK